MTDTTNQTDLTYYYQRLYDEMREKTNGFIQEALDKADLGKKVLFLTNSNARYEELASEIEAQSGNQNTSNIFIKTVDISNIAQVVDGFDAVFYDYVSLLPQNWSSTLSSETVR